MLLPEAFRERMVRIYGEEGREWLARLPGILARCEERWQLANLRPAGGLSYNLVCFAESPVHGAVVLKVAVHPDGELASERKMLSLYAGRGMCACYDSDPELGALLLARVKPGTDLRGVTSSAERFRIAAELFATLPIAAPSDFAFATYAGWTSRAFGRVRAEEGPEFRSLVDVAARLFAEIDGPEQVLLHGDLHHMNILQDGQSGWKVIDPKGVIGVRCFGAARFMQNEFRMGAREDRLQRLDLMTSLFAAALGESKVRIAQCAFVEHVLATCWSIEEHIQPEELQVAVQECRALLDYCSRLGSGCASRAAQACDSVSNQT